MILVEMTAAVDEFGTLRTFYLGTVGFTTSPTDTPPNVVFEPAIKSAGDLEIWAFAQGATSGSSGFEPGEVQVVNVDGQFDDWINYSFDGRPIVIRSGSGGAYPADFPVILRGTIESVSASMSRVTVTIRDAGYALVRPVLTTQYLGTNVGAVGLEGTAEDIKGRVKPRVYGSVFNIAPPCVNTSKLTYQVSDRAVSAISMVYDRGVALTAGANYADAAALTAATVAASTYATCRAAGLFRLGSAPTGVVTADVTEGAAAADRTVAEVLARLAADAGLASDALDPVDRNDLNILVPAVIGLYLDDETSFRDAMDEVVASVAAWWAFDASEKLRMGLLDPPAPPNAFRLIEADVLSGFERETADGNGIPAWRVNVRFGRFWTTQQPADVAGSVSADRRAALGQEYRSVSAEDPTIKHQFAQAREITVDTLLIDADDAQALADRLLAIYRVQRSLFPTPITDQRFAELGVQLMSAGQLTHRRFGMAQGRTLRALGYSLDLDRNRVVLQLWG